MPGIILHRRLSHLVLLSVVFIGLLAACSLPYNRRGMEPVRPWTAADLRLVDPADAPRSDLELLAVYLRRGESRSGLEIRLDFFDLSLEPEHELLIALDSTPGGAGTLPSGEPAGLQWDALLVIPGRGTPALLDSSLQAITGPSVRLLRDPELDSLQIHLDAGALPGSIADEIFFAQVPPGLKVKAFIRLPGEGISDESAVAALNAPAPKPAPLLLAFWNTFPAYTPAQALRAWDGAHTGPFGGRHGLFNLLRSARSHHTPLLLLDLKTPAWLTALDYAGDIELVESLARDRLVTIPDVWANVPTTSLHEYSVDLAKGFSLPVTGYAYAQDATALPPKYSLVFTPSSDFSNQPHAGIFNLAGQRVVTLPVQILNGDDSLRLLPTGLPPAAIRLLAASAASAVASPGESAITVLGGDMLRSGWGSPEAARAAFDYISAHPWIQVMDPASLASVPLTGSPPPVARVGSMEPARFFPPEPRALIQAAAQASLARPSSPAGESPGLESLRLIYDRLSGTLHAADMWARDPHPIAACRENLTDLSIEELCVLASGSLFTAYDLRSGALIYAVALGGDEPHQFVAPSSQLSYGMSDPTSWEPSAGPFADPAVIPGAFGDRGGLYQAQFQPGSLELRSESSGTLKRFTLLDNGLRIQVQPGETASLDAADFQLPLVVDPWLRFQPGWRQQYRGQRAETDVWWGTEDFQVRVSSNEPLQLHAFNDTQQLMGRVENPNTEYPPGHYLPFPMALVQPQVHGALDWTVTIFTK